MIGVRRNWGGFCEAPLLLTTTVILQKAPSGLFEQGGDERSDAWGGGDVGRGSELRPRSLSGIIHLCRAQLAQRSHLRIRFIVTLLCLEMTGMEGAQRR